MFDPGGVGEWSPPQSPFGGFRGKKTRIITSAMIHREEIQILMSSGRGVGAGDGYSTDP
jgi:hypothetical protein